MLLDLDRNSQWTDVDCSADLKHCLVEWFCLSKYVRKEGEKEVKLEEMEAIVYHIMHCSLLGRHVGKEGGREDMLEELESIAAFPYFE
jgi:hypothetical protein